MTRLLLDTTVVIDALRGRPAADRLRRRSDAPWVCAVTIEEVWRGARPAEHDSIRRFFDAVRIAPLGVAEGEQAGSWRRDLAQEGVTVHQADCLIAAAAVSIGAAIATGNPSDFTFDGLDVQHWPVGR